MKILVTGFDPFSGEPVNPAYEAVKLLPDSIAGAQIIKLQVPTRFALSGTVLEAAVNEHQPDAVICVGQAGGPPSHRKELPSTLRTQVSLTMQATSLWTSRSGRTVRPPTSPLCP